jgi:hypothetical protein
MGYGISSKGFVLGIVAASVAAGCMESTAQTTPDGTEVELGEARDELALTDQLTQVAVRFQTGGDDKRTDSQVFFQVAVNGVWSLYSAGGTGTTWSNGTWTGFFYGNLPAGTRNQDITNFRVSWQQGIGGFIQSGDNWNMEAVDIWVFDATFGAWVQKGTPIADPLQRFTGSTTSWLWPVGWPL